jgi:hypothetical protein
MQNNVCNTHILQHHQAANEGTQLVDLHADMRPGFVPYFSFIIIFCSLSRRHNQTTVPEITTARKIMDYDEGPYQQDVICYGWRSGEE